MSDHGTRAQVTYVEKNVIYECRAGSHAYGTNLPTSDLDIRGVCLLPDLAYYAGVKRLDQQERGWSDGVDKVIYNLPKFLQLASDANPNILELLWVEDADVTRMTAEGRRIRDSRRLFMSRKLCWTVMGFAGSQRKRLINHHKWIRQGAPEPPTRAQFEHDHVIDVGPLGTRLSAATEVLEMIPGAEPGWFKLRIKTFDASGYDSAKAQWDSFSTWRANRNELRAELEAHHGFDTKFALHLIRLLRMGCEALKTGELRVRRPDAEELLAIRAGAWSYERVIDASMALEAELTRLEPICDLPKQPDRDAIFEIQLALIHGALKRDSAL